MPKRPAPKAQNPQLLFKPRQIPNMRLTPRNKKNSEQQQPIKAGVGVGSLLAVRKSLLFLITFGLGMVTQYLWTSGNLELTCYTSLTSNNIKSASLASSLSSQSSSVTATKELKEGTSQQRQQLETPTENNKPIPQDEMSILEYYGCCGIGHRLVRMAVAYHASRKLGFRLTANWGYCGAKEIFGALFRPETPTELARYVTSRHEYFRADNEMPGYHPAKYNCIQEEMVAHYEFFDELQRRYKDRPKLEQFVQEHFHNRLSIGVHIRDGNGEKGDFKFKGRAIAGTPEEWVEKVSRHILQLLEQAQRDHQDKHNRKALPKPVLFVAGDNPDYVGLFRKQLVGQIPVVDWSQQHNEAGTGVFLGQAQEMGLDENTCFAKWRDLMGDMILLSNVDVMIAGQFSSFSQTMPLNLVLGRPAERNLVAKPYCEIHQHGDAMECHATQMDWCMNAKHFNVLKTLNNANSKGFQGVLDAMYSSPNYRNQTHNNNNK